MSLLVRNIVNGAIIMSLFSSHSITAWDPKKYSCSMCITLVDDMRLVEEAANIDNVLLNTCMKRFSKDLCEAFYPSTDKAITGIDPSKSTRQICYEQGMCPQPDQESWQRYTVKDTDDYDVRVSKALGSRGYDKVRVSVISTSAISGLSDVFDYSQQFKYKWTQNYLSSGIVSVTPGTTTTVEIANGKTIDINVPFEGEGIRGLIIADPCFQSQWITCDFQDTFDMFNHTVELLNAVNAHDDVSFWQVLGDNFYDQTGEATATLFSALSQQTKSKIFQTVPGNHDYWVHGGPYLHVPKDQLANGFMQYYGQDVIASSSDPSQPYDFSVDPSSSLLKSALPAASNFFFYNKVGNIGFMGYSGANSYDEQAAYFTEACTWASSADLDVFLLLGHWNTDNLGCEAEVTVPAIYDEFMNLDACKPIASKMKYFMGHMHCNQVTSPDLGFMVGGMGMAETSCTGMYGVTAVDSTNGSFNVYYFPLAVVDSFDNYDTILSCFKEKGVSGCYDLATLWSSTPL